MTDFDSYEWIKKWYRERMSEGYKQNDLDEMDIKFWFELHMVETEYVTADDLSWL